MKALYPIKVDLTGKRFERLVAIELAPKKYGDNSWWYCQCDCGKVVSVCSAELKKRSTKSCGCLRREAAWSITHGLSKTRFGRIWKGMVERCYKSYNPRHENYLRKGVIIEWKSIVDFKKDMYESYLAHVKEYGEKNTSIDRKDNGGNYCKENCRWATAKEQANNRK